MRRIVPALASLAALCAVTGTIFALRPVAPVVSLGVLYLLAVLPVAEVWGPAYGEESTYLHFYVSHPRRKIEPDPDAAALPAHRAGRRLPARRPELAE